LIFWQRHCPSRAGLNWHDVEAYFKPGGVGSYSFTEDNKVVFNKFDKPFEVVIMNDCSQCPIHPQLKDLFREYTQKHSQTVVKHGAKPALFMTWAYADRPEMTSQLAEQYTIAGNNNDALVIPAGLAFAKALSNNREIALYDRDKRHPVFSERIWLRARYTPLYTKNHQSAIPTLTESIRRPRIFFRRWLGKLLRNTLVIRPA
jgi:hypothetical protein